MKITYLDHSGFAVEQGETLLVFDEYNPRPAPGRAGLAGRPSTEKLSPSCARRPGMDAGKSPLSTVSPKGRASTSRQ